MATVFDEKTIHCPQAGGAPPRGGILKGYLAGMSAADLCRKHGVSDAAFYKWPSSYGDMDGEV